MSKQKGPLTQSRFWLLRVFGGFLSSPCECRVGYLVSFGRVAVTKRQTVPPTHHSWDERGRHIRLKCDQTKNQLNMHCCKFNAKKNKWHFLFDCFSVSNVWASVWHNKRQRQCQTKPTNSQTRAARQGNTATEIFKQYCAQYHARYAEGERRGELLQSLKTAREEVSAQPFGHNQRLRLTSFSIKPYHLRWNKPYRITWVRALTKQT